MKAQSICRTKQSQPTTTTNYPARHNSWPTMTTMLRTTTARGENVAGVDDPMLDAAGPPRVASRGGEVAAKVQARKHVPSCDACSSEFVNFRPTANETKRAKSLHAFGAVHREIATVIPKLAIAGELVDARTTNTRDDAPAGGRESDLPDAVMAIEILAQTRGVEGDLTGRDSPSEDGRPVGVPRGQADAIPTVVDHLSSCGDGADRPGWLSQGDPVGIKASRAVAPARGDLGDHQRNSASCEMKFANCVRRFVS